MAMTAWSISGGTGPAETLWGIVPGDITTAVGGTNTTEIRSAARGGVTAAALPAALRTGKFLGRGQCLTQGISPWILHRYNGFIDHFHNTSGGGAYISAAERVVRLDQRCR